MNEARLDQQPRILVVDDDADQLELVSRFLRQAGFSVQTAGDALTGFDLAKTIRPQLVISDVSMPNVDGIAFCNMIRSYDPLSNTPVLLVSAIERETKAIVEGLNRGADDYLEIPYEPAILIAKAVRLVEANRMAEELHREKECLRLAIAAARMGLWEWNIVTGEVHWSPDLERIHGMSPGTFGGTFESFLDEVHVDDREHVRHSLTRTLDHGADHTIEYRITLPNNEIHWVEGRGGVIRNRIGRPIQMIGLCMDITMRKQAEEVLRASRNELEKRVEERTAERRHLEEQLIQSQKLEAVGRLAAGVAHDFNNLLTAIIGHAQLALASLPPNDRLKRSFVTINKAADSAAALTRQLLAFSRKQVMQPRVLDLNSVVTELEKMLGRVIGEDIELRARLQRGLGNVKADPGQMEQVIMNLVVNARDAMPSGGKLTIETANTYLDETYAQRHIGALPGPYIMLAVSDTGRGMDEETRRHIFEPFFTTKGLGKGTGLGLATVYGIVKQSEGNIWVYSEPGKGTTFKVYLPRVDADAEEYTRADALVALPRGTETILLVEDDETVRELAQEVLEICGYRVLKAGSGKAALAICKQQTEPIHLLLTDVVMPEVSGPELAAQLLSLYPESPVLYMSGHTEDAIVHHGVLDEGTNLLQKPFSPAALAAKVRQVLDSAS